MDDDFFLLTEGEPDGTPSAGAGAPDRPDMDLAAWFPLLEAAGIPVPRTRLISTDAELVNLLDGLPVPGFEDLIQEVREAADEMGYPCFLRTGHGSGKHQFTDTCFLGSPEDVAPHVVALVDWSFSVDFFGLPTHTWVVREMLPVQAPLVAFKGMPVAKERRYFIDNGAVT